MTPEQIVEVQARSTRLHSEGGGRGRFGFDGRFH